METIARNIAALLGAEALFERYSHHLPRMTKVMLVGGFGFIIQTIIFEILGIWTRVVAPSTATLIGAECAIISNFTLNERFSFRDSVGGSSPLWQRLLKFHAVSSGSLATQWLCVFTAERIFHSVLALHAAFIIGVGLGFVINYTGYYFFVWRKSA